MTQHTILLVYNEIERVACFFVFLSSSGTECIAVTEVTLEAVGMQSFFSSIYREQDEKQLPLNIFHFINSLSCGLGYSGRSAR